MMDTWSRVRKIVFNRHVAGFLVLLLGVWIASTQPFGYWLKPVSGAVYFGFWETRGLIQPLLGRSFVTQLLLFWAWFAAYSLLLAVCAGNAYRHAVITG
jgi:hypothetical protein